jgi:RNA polymerase sigma-70 factor (sigma-E family)
VADRAEAEFCAYVAARQHALLRTAYLLTGDQHNAEDLVQTALAKAYLAWGKLHDSSQPEAYIRKIMVNEYASWWRRPWRRNERPTGDLPERPGAERQASFDERDAMWQLVSALPPRQRATVVLRYYEDLSEAETAQVLGCSVGTVKSQTNRAIAQLRQRVGTDNGLEAAR